MKSVLIANRGEIALRIKRAALELGIEPIMLASEVDRNALHCVANPRCEVLYLPGKNAADTYLNIEKIVALAKEHECDALHPGYGFLSENGDFAQQVEDAGITFIGPTPEVIHMMGDKLAAKELAKKANVPLSPSCKIENLSPKILKQVKDEVGFPLLLKAKAGGGGRGMRLVREETALLGECERAQAEALKFFGDGTIFAERYRENPRHIEVQVFGDGTGRAVHVGTRDCSTQRRHQKLVEEAPAPHLSEETRRTLHESAVALASQVQYRGAGTVEFLVEGEEISFLEMNTRIQVEHPVSEEVYGIDLVQWQFRIAQGEKISEDLSLSPEGHAFEFRIYAEDPSTGFLPDLGTIRSLSLPEYPFLRIERGVQEGSTISPYYDALLFKVIISGRSRDDALQNARRVLKEISIEGVKTTLPFHLWLTHESSFSETPFPISRVDSLPYSEAFQNVPLYERIESSHAQCKELFFDYTPIELLEGENSFGKSMTIELKHRKDGLYEGKSTDDTTSSVLSHSKSGVVRSLTTRE
jgi:acetyl/propionyl-CoA carboxylase alpha subunit